MEYKLIIKNDRLILTGRFDGYTGNVNTYSCYFNIDTDVDGLEWFCVFKQGESCYVQLINNNRCIIPYEVLSITEPLYVGCYAVAAGETVKRISTNWVAFDLQNGAYCEGATPSVPTPDVWETLVMNAVPIIGDNGDWYVYDLEKKEYIDTGKIAQGTTGVDGYTPQKGTDYWTDDDKAEIVDDVKDELDFDAKLEGKQDILTFDETPAINSTNPVTSDGVFRRIVTLDSRLSDVEISLIYKQDIATVIIYADDEYGTVMLRHNQEARLATVPEVDGVPTLSLVLPDTLANNYESYLCFTSGDVATNVIYSGIKFVGVDCDSDGVFSPMANVNYEIAFKNLGTGDSPNIIARVGSW
ncbi:MAG: hypothetical protein J6C82_03645 [Clostridia bacterium]|nr:hypothetical protein [Clostridia bacterium]